MSNKYMVVIDTNCFEKYKDSSCLSPYCANDECDTFLTERKSRSDLSIGQFYITESVFGEIVKQRKEKLDEAKKELKNLETIFNTTFSCPDDPDFEDDLRKYLSENNINILEHPNNDVFPDIIKRAMNKKLPFKTVGKEASDKGFKDVLIWETLLNFDYEAQSIKNLFFITANSKDFPLSALLPEWKTKHPTVHLDIIGNWKDFSNAEKTLFYESIVEKNINYNQVLELFKDENPQIIELPNFKKSIKRMKDTHFVEIETDIKKTDGKIYTGKYYYDLNVNDISLTDPSDYDIDYMGANNDE